ncbi:MAG: PGDYG domain-containing protein [Rhodomicrobium sp.]
MSRTVMEIDRHSPEIAKLLEIIGVRYRKLGVVHAERAVVATPVVTSLTDGTVETKSQAQPGDYIVTAPAGERYVVKQETFLTRYARKPGSLGVWRDHSRRKSISAAHRHFGLLGDGQHGASDCMIADVFHPSEGRRGEPCLIGRAEFENTYAKAEG